MDSSLFGKIKIFILFYCISRFFLLFIPFSIPDAPYVSMSVEDALLSRNLPYPPLFQFQLAIFLFVFGPNLVGYRIGLMIYEVGCLLLLYKFVFRYQTIEFKKIEKEANNLALKALYIFAFFPGTIFNYSGNVELLATFFMLLALYSYYQEKLILSSFAFCMGFLLEIYPIFCLVPIMANLLIQKKLKSVLKIAVIFVGTFVLCNIPFYFLNPTDFFESYLVQFSRVPRAESLWEIPYNMGVTWNLINVAGLFVISPVGLSFLIWIGAYVIFSLVYSINHKNVSKQTEFALMLIFFLFLPLVFLSLFSRYLFFSFPLICLLFEIRLNPERLTTRARNALTIIIPTAIITLLIWPDLLLTTVQQDSYVLPYSVAFIFLFCGFYLLLSIPWLKSQQKFRSQLFPEERPDIFKFLTTFFISLFIQTLVVWFGQVFNSEIVSNLIMISIFALGIVPLFLTIKIIYKML